MKLNVVLETLKSFKPLSIFVYGSQANEDVNTKSDYEIGVIFEDKKYIPRAKIKESISDNKYAIFPFKLTELQNNEIDTPFQKSIFINSLILGNAKTVYGANIIELLPCPPITETDLLMDASFNLGYAMSAVRLMKEGNIDLANEIFYKSLFYSTRDLIYLKSHILTFGYTSIYDESKNLKIPKEFRELIDVAYKLRQEKKHKVDSAVYYKNISYINKFVIPSIQEELKVNTDFTVN